MPAPCLVIRTGLQRLGLCGGGFLGLASELDAAGTLEQVRCRPCRSWCSLSFACFNARGSLALAFVTVHAGPRQSGFLGLPRRAGELPLVHTSRAFSTRQATCEGFMWKGEKLVGMDRAACCSLSALGKSMFWSPSSSSVNLRCFQIDCDWWRRPGWVTDQGAHGHSCWGGASSPGLPRRGPSNRPILAPKRRTPPQLIDGFLILSYMQYITWSHHDSTC